MPLLSLKIMANQVTQISYYVTSFFSVGHPGRKQDKWNYTLCLNPSSALAPRIKYCTHLLYINGQAHDDDDDCDCLDVICWLTPCHLLWIVRVVYFISGSTISNHLGVAAP